VAQDFSPAITVILKPVLLCSFLALTAVAAAQTPAIQTVTLPQRESPLIAVRVMLTVGSIHDPAGKEGLAALTALMVGQAGTRRHTYKELLEALYPIASSIGVRTDREVTVFVGEAHRETLERYTALLTEVLLEPAFTDSDLQRNREQLLAYLTSTLRSANDELLGLEMIQQKVFEGHPYDHSPAGTVEGLKSVTLDDVKRFYAEHYTRANILLGVAGGYPENYVAGLQAFLSKLPVGKPGLRPLPQPKAPKGRHFTLIEKKTDSTGIHLAHPLPVTRADPDFYPLLVANSFLGEHRTFHGRLMNELRGLRGLNYGDYSYIEHWHNPPGTTSPAPNVPRRHQYFSVWVRPVAAANAAFALRNALFEVDRLTTTGMTQAEFDLTRRFVVNYSKLWAQTLSNRLGLHLDSRFYGTPYFIDEIDKRLGQLTVDDVNRVAKKYIRTDALRVVMVLGDAAGMKAALEAGKPSPMKYESEVPAAVKEADKAIQAIPIRPAAIEIVPAAQVFQR